MSAFRIINNTITLNKEINELDKFVFDFTDILKQHSDYVIVSGYVAILLGRSRASEDIDLLIPEIDFEKFEALYEALTPDYWFLNSIELEDLYEVLNTGHSVRIAKKDEVIPNIELKFIKSKIDKETFKNKVTVIINKNKIFISPIELQIAYKREILKSEKDIEDALHLYEVLKDSIDKDKLEKYSSDFRKWK